MVRQQITTDTIRLKLINLLPRLRRFALILAGEGQRRDTLLKAACTRMLQGPSHYQQGTAFDRWAFTELYGVWLEMLRDHSHPMTQGRGDAALFLEAFAEVDAGKTLAAETADILSRLPPQQRGAALLVYGEGFGYGEAAQVLDVSPQTVMERSARVLVALMEGAGDAQNAPDSANVETLYPMERQTGQ